MSDKILLPHEHRHPVHGTKFKVATGPYPVIDANPSFKTCWQNFGNREYAIWGVTAAIPTAIGLRAGTYKSLKCLFHI
jgi:hypothetical protein